MRIVTENRQSVLPSQRGDPKIVLGNRLASKAELITDVGINTTGLRSNDEYNRRGFEFIKPTLTRNAKPG